MTPEDTSRFEAIRNMVREAQENMRRLMIAQQELLERQQEAIDALIRDHAESRRIFEAFQARASTDIEWLKRELIIAEKKKA